LNGQSVQELVPEDQKVVLGDYWRVLRVRPPTNKFSAEKPHLEYIPNNTYGYNEVKMTLDNVKRLKVKPTRYWNELLVKDVPDDILYSLSDFYPGLPYEANIIRDNESLGLPIYRIRETVFMQDQAPPMADNEPEEGKPRKRVNVEATIANLIGLGALPDGEQASLEHYMLNTEEVLRRYEGYLRDWPFLVAQRLLKMQVMRLKNIKHALTEKLNNHPLSLLIQQSLDLTRTKETLLHQQTPRPKAEGRWATTPKVRIARVKSSTSATGASSALTLLTRVSSI
jgi:hypothetical protein